MPTTLAVCTVVAVLGAAVGRSVDGWPTAVGVVAGVGVVAASYVLSSLAIAWADSVNPQLVFPVGMTAYVIKFGVLGVAMVALVNSGWDGMVPLGLGIAVGVVAWTGAQIWWVSGPGKPGGPADAVAAKVRRWPIYPEKRRSNGG